MVKKRKRVATIGQAKKRENVKRKTVAAALAPVPRPPNEPVPYIARTRVCEIINLTFATAPNVIVGLVVEYLEREVAFVFDNQYGSWRPSVPDTTMHRNDTLCWLWDPWHIHGAPSENQAPGRLSYQHRERARGSSEVRVLPTVSRTMLFNRDVKCYGSTVSAFVTVYHHKGQTPLILSFDTVMATIGVHNPLEMMRLQKHRNVTDHEWDIPVAFQRRSSSQYTGLTGTSVRMAVDTAHPYIVYIVGYVFPDMERQAHNANEEEKGFYGLRLDMFDTEAQTWTVLSRLANSESQTRMRDISHMIFDARRRRLCMATDGEDTYGFDLENKKWILPAKLSSYTPKESNRRMVTVIDSGSEIRMPPRLCTYGSSSTSVFWQNRWIIAGGQDPDFSYSETSAFESLLCMSEISDEHTKKPAFQNLHAWTLPDSVNRASFCVLNGQLYLIGGAHRDRQDARESYEAYPPVDVRPSSCTSSQISICVECHDTNLRTDASGRQSTCSRYPHWRPLAPRTPTTWKNVLSTSVRFLDLELA